MHLTKCPVNFSILSVRASEPLLLIIQEYYCKTATSPLLVFHTEWSGILFNGFDARFHLLALAEGEGVDAEPCEHLVEV